MSRCGYHELTTQIEHHLGLLAGGINSVKILASTVSEKEIRTNHVYSILCFTEKIMKPSTDWTNK